MSYNIQTIKYLLCENKIYDTEGDYHNAAWEYAQSTPYTDFYKAWHSKLEDPVDNCFSEGEIEVLENQLTNIPSQLQPTDKTYPIFINAQALAGETDPIAIAQALCNRIYRSVFGDDSEIPEVSNAFQLERSLSPIKKHLQKPKLALILDKWEPNEIAIAFCHKLTDVLDIAFITNQPLESPLKGFPPNQPNLISAIQTWLNEL